MNSIYRQNECVTLRVLHCSCFQSSITLTVHYDISSPALDSVTVLLFVFLYLIWQIVVMYYCETSRLIQNIHPAPASLIPDICHGRHGRRPCKFFLDGVNFYRFNAKNWHFRQILREKVAFFFTDLTRKIGVFRCKFYSPKILPV